MAKTTLQLSPLAHTWVLDFDGTLVEHNGYKTGKDRFLPGALEFLHGIPKDDVVIILTAREPEARGVTEAFLAENNVSLSLIIVIVLRIVRNILSSRQSWFQHLLK